MPCEGRDVTLVILLVSAIVSLALSFYRPPDDGTVRFVLLDNLPFACEFSSLTRGGELQRAAAKELTAMFIYLSGPCVAD
ncbi:hypothetical protein ANCCEY_03817 [Ancylostoma ceylanicum]|uniref:Uncharacterized protein n=1 Tax=Ancylostoma ceylanicum TaxID=53326 RepID=A0A0D6M406_9BILA|nr:hypothetical protein ANCCEY_03817 [Ancylostoma ceylanicum]